MPNEYLATTGTFCYLELADADNASDGAEDAAVVDAAVVDAADAEASDGPFCHQSLNAWCAMANAGCVRDWASAMGGGLTGGVCAAWSVGVCDGYDILSWRGVDGLSDVYYDKMTGQLVAIVNTGYGYVPPCVGGPADFVPPSGCSPSTPLCDVLGDARYDGMGSGGE